MKPIIVVTSTFDNGHTFLHKDYSNAIIEAGGIPFVMPYMASQDMLDQICEMADGLMLSGGEDIDPFLYGEEPAPGLGAITPERDVLESRLTERFLKSDKPILAICRGLQLLNAVAGGTLIQDIERAQAVCLQHRQQAPRAHLSHQIHIESGSLLERIIGSAHIRVNSFHHQAVKRTAPDFRVNATAADGIIEGLESMIHRFVLGVQWHPENLAGTNEAANDIFRAFVHACISK
ncbi:gamma-glutamyl-gamma-aminobutyrate hydrolase family protein [Paenibacillus qinlingensis]|uniref:Glutamine amidotransferase n=1 Tax=Paenibacillus qinlingensis TaxID=1837343 RepID=A0ABU1NRG4_9BACL|nr:gamma-glutamyl-gamma-aminobutyrate hydrolase family protein [Paenibacillus qinlingensis]MDR6550077.1 putative glutamine amidotransferase [Paenibacillus qinlingensis]